MWRKRNRRKHERWSGQRSVFPLETAAAHGEADPDSVFSALELDFFRRAEELYVFESWTDLEADPA
jgi:hypothetical protein